MTPIQSFKDLIVWQKAMGLVVEVYEVVKRLPREEKYALGDQMRRCAVSIPSNIAAGSKRNNRKEFIQFCGIAQGSGAELETQLLLVGKLYAEIDATKPLSLLLEVQRMLTKLNQKLRIHN